MSRLPLEPAAELVSRVARRTPCRVAVFEDMVSHTNLGAGLRSAAALGIDAVLVTPRCADPLYRRSVRVSMGAVFQVPWTRLDAWPGDLAVLRAAGFTVAALSLTADTVTLDELAARRDDRLALVLGTEGDGLATSTLAATDLSVRIPMAGGVDSLNVAAAAAVAFYATRR
jgi:tRNA G18 (ribose-2'-O)-methylase SpoU